MDWREVRVRAAQEIHKQGEVILHRLGIRQGLVRLDAKAKNTNGVFFFTAAEASDRAKLLRQHLPDEAAAVLLDAEAICRHRFRLLGYENLRFAEGSDDGLKDIDWHLDPVHGKRAAMELWFKIPFLEFAAVGDHKVTWELNRHQHLVTLAKAWLLSGDEKFAVELIAQWRSWVKANPYPLGINWGSSLEVAFRSLSWIWIDQLLMAEGTTGRSEARSGALSAFRAELAPALAFHGRYIERYLSTYFSLNTHLLGEAVALFFLGTLYPQIPHAARWKDKGWKVILDEAQRQVRPDGVYFEQSLYYHVYALDFFLYARSLAARNHLAIPPEFDATLNKMLDVVEALAQAGPAETFGDDDGGRLFNSRRNRTEHMTDPLALGALLYSRDSQSAQLTEEAIWLFGKDAVEKLSSEHLDFESSAAARSLAFPDGGIYVLADSEPYPQVMSVDAGPQGVGRSGHGHADALSVRLTMNGRRWLVDSGSGVYISKDPVDRDTYRGTGAHNTMRVDGTDQAVPGEPFSWTQIPATVAENWIAGKTFTYFVGSHNGYQRLSDPVVHRRQVLKISGDLWLVRDIALGNAEHQIEVRWHFAPDLEMRRAVAGQFEISSTMHPNDATLSLIVPDGTVWQSETEVTRTVLSPAYGALQASPLLRSRARVRLPAELATVLIPQRGASRHNDQASVQPESVGHDHPRLASMAQAAVQVYELAYEGASYGFFFARSEAAWNFGPWSSDAAVLYCRIEQEKIKHLVMIGGTQVAWQGEPILSASRPFDFFEWRGDDSVMNAVPKEFSFTPLFAALTGMEIGVETRTGDAHSAQSSMASSTRGSSSYAEKS